jgi:hypothetical protein
LSRDGFAKLLVRDVNRDGGNARLRTKDFLLIHRGIGHGRYDCKPRGVETFARRVDGACLEVQPSYVMSEKFF